MPISLSVLATRMEISPRLAIRTFSNTAAEYCGWGCPGAERTARKVAACVRVLLDLPAERDLYGEEGHDGDAGDDHHPRDEVGVGLAHDRHPGPEQDRGVHHVRADDLL